MDIPATEIPFFVKSLFKNAFKWNPAAEGHKTACKSPPTTRKKTTGSKISKVHFFVFVNQVFFNTSLRNVS